MTFQNLTFSFFKKRVDTLVSIRQGFNNFFFTLNTFYKLLIVFNYLFMSLINMNLSDFKRFSRISCSLIQGSRIHWGGIQPPSTSSDPRRWHHPSIWQAGVWGLRLIREPYQEAGRRDLPVPLCCSWTQEGSPYDYKQASAVHKGSWNPRPYVCGLAVSVRRFCVSSWSQWKPAEDFS